MVACSWQQADDWGACQLPPAEPCSAEGEGRATTTRQLKVRKDFLFNRKQTEPVLRQCLIPDPQSAEAASVGYPKCMLLSLPDML